MKNRHEWIVESLAGMVIILFLRYGLPGSPISRFRASMAAFWRRLLSLYHPPTPSFKIRRFP
jgi:hypothetical protein